MKRYLALRLLFVIVKLMNTNKLYQWAINLSELNPIFLYVTVYALFFLKSFVNLDPDFGWHLASGQYTVAHGIPYHDIYSYTAPTFAWVHHEWLADIGNYLAYHYLGGYVALCIIYAAMWTLALWLLTRHTEYRLLVLFFAILLLPLAGVRAITWSALLSAVLIVVALSKSKRAYWFAPLVVLFWANVHGSFVLGIAYLLWRLATRRTKRNALVALISIALSFINPYGADMYVEVFRTMTDTSLHTTIAEWAPLQLGLGVGIFVGIWIAMIVVGQKPSWKKFIRFETILLVMAISSFRQAVPFVLFAIPTVLTGLKGLKKLPLPKDSLPVKRIIITAVALLASMSILLVLVEFHGHPLNREVGYPSKIAADLRAQPCQGNVFANYNYGGYLIWKVPGQKLFIDGRMPSWSLNGQDFMADYIKIMNDTSYQKQEFSRYNVRCVVWDKQSTFAKSLQKEGWKITQTEPMNDIVLLTK